MSTYLGSVSGYIRVSESAYPAQLRVGSWAPTYPPVHILVSGETVWGPCASGEAHPRGGGRVVVTGQKESSSRSGEVQIYRESECRVTEA